MFTSKQYNIYIFNINIKIIQIFNFFIKIDYLLINYNNILANKMYQDKEFISLLSNLSLDNTDYINIEINELNIGFTEINSTINLYYTQVDKLQRLFNQGTILNNKNIVIILLEFTIIYNRVLNLIKLNSKNYQFDLAINKLDKLTPQYYLSFLQSNIYEEQYKIIEKNYYYYLNKFFSK